MIISIHQPNYIPWLGYFYKIYQSDIFVFLDDVQFSNEGMHNYHYLKTPQGSFRLKIPVEQHIGDLIMDVKTKDQLGWKEKHLKIIESNYKKAPYFDLIFNDFSSVLSKNYAGLSELNIALIEFFVNKLSIETKLVKSSELAIQSKREEKVLDICKILGGTVYYSGTGAKAYQNPDDFLQQGIELRYSTFTPFDYPQLWNDRQTNVTILDYLMNCGYAWNRVLDNQKIN